MSEKNKIIKTEEEWKKLLTPEQFRILREKGTEAPFSGEYNLTKENGIYRCAACGYELFMSDNKFDSHCGWPSFDAPAGEGSVATAPDNSHGMSRTEILCSRCGSHLGHVFDDGPTATGLRYCVNSVSLKLDTTQKK